MLKKLWNSLQSEKPKSPAAESFDRAKLTMLYEHFSIGSKPRYYPEYRREIVFHTIILAYRANDHYLYSRDAVLTDDDGLPTGFLVARNQVLPWQQLKKFQILLPDTTEMEKKLDYFTRAEIGRAGQFGVGNAITLVADTARREIATVDTQVDRRQAMPTGPFADASTILVSPDLSTLLVADKRQKQRIQSDTQAALYVADGGPPIGCILSDFSEAAMRLAVVDEQQVMPPLASDENVIVEFNFGEVSNAYRIRGRVFRRTDDFCVVKLERIYRDGEFEKIKMMDIMEIKTGMLNRHS